MNKKVTVGGQEVFVEFSGYYDTTYGEFLFTQVMCDVFMPGGEIVPVAVEKEQIRKVLEGFKKREALYREIRKETVKGKSCYVITPRMRYDLGWLAGKKKVILSKDKPPVEVPADAASVSEAQAENPRRGEGRQAAFQDARRKHLQSEGYRYNEQTKNWEIGSIRFPDAMVGKASTDEEFIRNMARLREADEQAARSRKAKPLT
ncbi:hypothetical protein [Cohnella caldifontis]|uniref:hypothetical protein n=1 Tax=Cohnella caldifontis TaxID=3027471 RepID=UPI0023EB55CE|nr:hypothetical protein [Cohnella sp. YIM B05605]